jgi:hypothetical protein
MRIQEIMISNNKKKLLKSITDNDVIYKEDNGDIVVNVEAYQNLKQDSNSAPIETMLDDDTLDFDNEYFVFI